MAVGFLVSSLIKTFAGALLEERLRNEPVTGLVG